MTDNNGHSSRRDVLKVVGSGAMAANTLSGTTLAAAGRSSEYFLGQTHFVDVTLTYGSNPKAMGHHDDGATHVVGTNGVLGLQTGNVQPFENGDDVAGFRWSYATGDTTLAGEEISTIYHDASPSWRSPNFMLLDEPYQEPAVDVSFGSGPDVQVTAGGRSRTVRVGSETTLELPAETVSKRPEYGESTAESREIVPELTVNNYGDVRVYGGEQVLAFPLQTDQDWVERKIEYIRAGAYGDDVEVSTSEDHDVLIASYS